MALPFGVSWLHALLLWACIYFPPQKDYKLAHGFPLSGVEFSSPASMFGPQIPNQFHSGASLKTIQDSVSPRDEMQAMRPKRFVSLQREPVYHENNKDASSVTGLSEEMVQKKSDSERDAPSAPPVLKYEHEGSGYQHPFGLLVKEHKKEKTMEDVSFPTIRDFKRFIETMKRSFLMPGSDFGRHFQTARETMENEMASNAQNVKGEHDMGYRSNSAEKGTAHDDANENEVRSEAMNTAFEESEQDANYQMPSESLSVPDPVDSPASLISTSVYDSQDSGPGSALYPHHHLGATQHVSRNYGTFDSGSISRENPGIFTKAPHMRNEHVQSASYTLPEQIPSGSFFGEDLSFSSHVTPSPVNPPTSPSQDFSYYSSKTSNNTPLNSKNIQQPKYKSTSKDSLTGYEKESGGFELGNDFQSEEPSRVTPANVLSVPMHPSLNSYGKSVYVSAPRGQHYIPDYPPKHRIRPTQSFQAYQPTVGKESKDINYTPTIHLPVFTGSLPSSSDNTSPQSSSSHVGVQTSSPHDVHNHAFNRKQPVRLKTMFTAKPSSSLPGSSRHDGYLRDQTVSISRPSTLTVQAKDKEKSDLSKQNLGSATQESASGGSALTLSGYFGRNGGNTKRLPPQTGPNMSPTSVKAYVVKSRNSYVRGKVSLSKTRYSPYTSWMKTRNTASHNVKGLEEQ